MIYNLDITLAFHVFQAFYLHSVHLDTLCALFFFCSHLFAKRQSLSKTTHICTSTANLKIIVTEDLHEKINKNIFAEKCTFYRQVQ